MAHALSFTQPHPTLFPWHCCCYPLALPPIRPSPLPHPLPPRHSDQTHSVNPSPKELQTWRPWSLSSPLQGEREAHQTPKRPRWPPPSPLIVLHSHGTPSPHAPPRLPSPSPPSPSPPLPPRRASPAAETAERGGSAAATREGQWRRRGRGACRGGGEMKAG